MQVLKVFTVQVADLQVFLIFIWKKHLKIPLVILETSENSRGERAKGLGIWTSVLSPLIG